MLWEDDVSLVPDGDMFSLNVPGQPSIRLTDKQVLILARAAVGLRAQVLLRQSGTTENQTIVTQVEDLESWIDSIRENVLVTLATRNSGDVTFAFAPVLARKLLDQIPGRLLEIEEPLTRQ